MGGARELSALVAGRYEVQGEIARGGMGIVYRALDHVTGKVLALKRSSEGSEASVDLIRSVLKREYQTLVTLRHPYIIEVYDFGVDEVGPYYTMELLDGTDLRAKSPLPWRAVCAYLRDVASSLALLHSRRLLHCDVSVANIRLTSEGRAKLLDFGGLVSFGKNTLVAGTPPAMAPEVLDRLELDQRVDLYALGATAYYALCGRHAYPASVLQLLRALWAAGRPPAPSSLVADIPAELDELVMSMLELDRMARPLSAAEVIDRLGAIAELEPDQDLRVQRSYLYCSDVVGREAERGILASQLEQLTSGRGGGALIEAPSGLGKSYLLEDAAQRARLAGAHVVTVQARVHRGPYGVWSALQREAGVDGPSRGRRESTQESFLKLAEQKPLVLAIEELHEADAESLAALAKLAGSLRHKPCLLYATVDSADLRATQPALRLLREHLPSIELRPFDDAATQSFVRGLFGDVEASSRLAAFLHNHAAGHPGAYTQVVQHLIEQGFIRYAEGTWILPDELPTVGPGGIDLAAIVDAGFDRKIAGWSVSLRTLALALSPHRRSFDLAFCRALVQGEPELEGAPLAPLLHDLVREKVLVEEHGGGYAFAGSRIREILYKRLSESDRKRLHARLGQLLADRAGKDPKRGFEIGFHLLLADQDRKARTHINRNVEASLMDADLLIESVPDLWALLEQQRSAGASDEEVQFIEALLITSGYYIDPTVFERADRVLTVQHRTLGFATAERLAPYLGRALALTAGILGAFFRSLFRKPYLVSGSSFATSLLVFVGACAAYSASACFSLDPRVHPRLIALLDMARGLGRTNAFRLVWDLFSVGSNVARGRFAEAEAGLRDQLERLSRVPLMKPEARKQYEAGLQFFIGRVHLLRLDSQALACADRIDELGAKHDRLMAHFLRRTHHLYRGDLAATKREEERFEQMAATLGARWVADTLHVLEFAPYHLAADVVGLKRTMHRIDALLPVAPNLATHREVVHAMYEGHRGRADLALKIYAEIEPDLVPFVNPVWTLARGHQAECFNTLGRPKEALKVCEDARAQLSEADRVYAFATQQLEREAATALAKLGRIDEAVQIIDGLLRACAAFDSPLMVGLLHHDRARIACAAHDREAFEKHAEAARAAFASIANPALMARAKRLLDLGRTAGLVATTSDSPEPLRQSDTSLISTVRAERALEQVVQMVGARWASLHLVVGGRSVLSARHGDAAAASEIEAEVSNIARRLEGEVSGHDSPSVASRIPIDLRGLATLVPLVTSTDQEKQRLVGLLALGDCKKAAAIAKIDLGTLTSQLIEEDEATDVIAGASL